MYFPEALGVLNCTSRVLHNYWLGFHYITYPIHIQNDHSHIFRGLVWESPVDPSNLTPKVVQFYPNT